MDFQVGGEEALEGRFRESGTVTLYEARFHLIEPDRRLFYIPMTCIAPADSIPSPCRVWNLKLKGMEHASPTPSRSFFWTGRTAPLTVATGPNSRSA
jgi:hypothetical protein